MTSWSKENVFLGSNITFTYSQTRQVDTLLISPIVSSFVLTSMFSSCSFIASKSALSASHLGQWKVISLSTKLQTYYWLLEPTNMLFKGQHNLEHISTYRAAKIGISQWPHGPKNVFLGSNISFTYSQTGQVDILLSSPIISDFVLTALFSSCSFLS